MFRKRESHISSPLNAFLRAQGIETPLLQHRLIAAWESIVGPTAASQTMEKFIKNQTLFVKILSPALRSELSACSTDIVEKLNAKVGSRIITSLRIY